MPEITRRSSTLRAPGWFFGKCGSIAAHASSDNQNNAPCQCLPMIHLAHGSGKSHHIKPLIGFEP